MKKIFCLETEWEQTEECLKEKSSVLPLLDFIHNTLDIDYIFRNVATYDDFEYYINHLHSSRYKDYDYVYLCFHGQKRHISFANGINHDILDLAVKHQNIFKDKIVHFGCCSTLNVDEDVIKSFKRTTGAKIVTGYARPVNFMESFIFEMWLINYISNNSTSRAQTIVNKAFKEMPFFADRFSFTAY